MTEQNDNSNSTAEFFRMTTEQVKLQERLLEEQIEGNNVARMNGSSVEFGVGIGAFGIATLIGQNRADYYEKNSSTSNYPGGVEQGLLYLFGCSCILNSFARGWQKPKGVQKPEKTSPEK